MSQAGAMNGGKGGVCPTWRGRCGPLQHAVLMDNRQRKPTWRVVRATSVSITGPRSSFSRCTSSMMSRRTCQAQEACYVGTEKSVAAAAAGAPSSMMSMRTCQAQGSRAEGEKHCSWVAWWSQGGCLVVATGRPLTPRIISPTAELQPAIASNAKNQQPLSTAGSPWRPPTPRCPCG